MDLDSVCTGVTVGLAATAILACGQPDGHQDPSPATTTIGTGDSGIVTASDDSSTGSGSTTSSSTGHDADTGTGRTTSGAVGDSTAGDSGSGTDGEPEEICPPGPFTGSPLPSPDLQAPAIPGTNLMVHGGGLVEGPVWIDGSLYLSKFAFGQAPPSSILRYTPPSTFEVAIEQTGSNGLAVASDGMILAATHDDGSLSRFDPRSGARTSLGVEFEGTRLNSPNDLVIRADGTIYFTDPNYQAPNPNPQPIHGVYRRTPQGEVELVDGSLNLPNGITLSPDQSVLYVGSPAGLHRYAVAPDGSVVTPSEPFGNNVGGVDGMVMDCAGNIYATIHSQGVVRVLDPDGMTLGTIMVAPSVTNAAFGGPQRTTLYITAGDSNNGDALYAVDLNIPGFPY